MQTLCSGICHICPAGIINHINKERQKKNLIVGHWLSCQWHQCVHSGPLRSSKRFVYFNNFKKKKPNASNKRSRKRDKSERTKAFPGMLSTPPGLCDCKHCTAFINRNRWAKMSGGRVAQPGAATWRGSNAGASDGRWQLPAAQAVAAVSRIVAAQVEFLLIFTHFGPWTHENIAQYGKQHWVTLYLIPRHYKCIWIHTL